MVEYELLDWVDINKLDLDDLKIYNPNGIYLYDDIYDEMMLLL
jgi:hypothetical protein